MRSAEERAAESRQQERSGGCTQTERPASRRTSHAGLPRRVRGPHAAGTEPQLSRRQQRSHARDESSQGDISELGDSLRRPGGLFPAPPRRLAGKTAGNPSVRRRAEQTYQQLDFLMGIRKETRKEL